MSGGSFILKPFLCSIFSPYFTTICKAEYFSSVTSGCGYKFAFCPLHTTYLRSIPFQITLWTWDSVWIPECAHWRVQLCHQLNLSKSAESWNLFYTFTVDHSLLFLFRITVAFTFKVVGKFCVERFLHPIWEYHNRSLRGVGLSQAL